MKVQEYIREDGLSPYQKWFDNLDPIAAAKVTVAKSRLELGNTSNVKWFGGIGEYRIDWGPGYRIYLAQDGKQLIVLFGGGTKKGQQSDIEQARELHEEYKRRKKNASEDENDEMRKKRKKR
jgi:putative addiction module killer protein